MVSYWRLLLLALFAGVFIFFWDFIFLAPFKVFVVFLHEISHAMGAILTGGTVNKITISWNESGLTKTMGGNFLAIASSGYLGSIVWGSSMLYSSLQNKAPRIISSLTGSILLYFTFRYFDDLEVSIFFLGLLWGLLFLATCFFILKVNRFLLFFMGGLTSLYAVYDLGDFFRGDVLKTDAGIIARHYLGDMPSALPTAYFIGIFLSAVSIWIFIRLVYRALHIAPVEEEIPQAEDADFTVNSLENIDPETLKLLELINRQRIETQER
ncbi:MAG: M50 family metallopeptidase [Spirochaetia bacterium]|nr:M50 family metallopeptidase [Spirochaetia bacterium]